MRDDVAVCVLGRAPARAATAAHCRRRRQQQRRRRRRLQRREERSGKRHWGWQGWTATRARRTRTTTTTVRTRCSEWLHPTLPIETDIWSPMSPTPTIRPALIQVVAASLYVGRAKGNKEVRFFDRSDAASLPLEDYLAYFPTAPADVRPLPASRHADSRCTFSRTPARCALTEQQCPQCVTGEASPGYLYAPAAAALIAARLPTTKVSPSAPPGAVPRRALSRHFFVRFRLPSPTARLTRACT